MSADPLPFKLPFPEIGNRKRTKADLAEYEKPYQPLEGRALSSGCGKRDPPKRYLEILGTMARCTHNAVSTLEMFLFSYGSPDF